MKKLLGIVVLGLLWIIPVSANERFIPLELFTGGEIRNDTEIKFIKKNGHNIDDFPIAMILMRHLKKQFPCKQ